MKFTYGKIRSLSRFLLIAFIFTGAFLGLSLAWPCYVRLGYLRLVCPVGFCEVCLSSGTIYWHLLPAAGLVVLAVFILGRAFCSWLCPAEIIGAWAAAINKKLMPGRTYKKVTGWWRGLKISGLKLGRGDALALFTGAMIGIAIFGYPFISTFCPLGVMGRNIISLVKHLEVRWDLLFLALPLLMAPLFSGGWKKCCPVGVCNCLLSGVNRTLVPEVDTDLCNGCGACQRVCPLGMNPRHGNLDTSLCQKCLICVDACPKNAIKIKMLVNKSHPKTRESAGRKATG